MISIGVLGDFIMRIVLFEIRSGIISVKQRSTLGIQWCGSLLRKSGYDDVSIMLFEGEQEKNIEKVLLSNQYDVCIIEFRSGIRDLAYRIIRRLKEKNKDVKIVAIGHDITLHAARFMKECSNIDIVAYGEAELTVKDICDYISNGKSLTECKGIFYRKGSVIFRNEARELPDNLDYLEPPALDIAKEQFGYKMQQTVFLASRTSRGCLGNCTFCSLNRLTSVTKKKAWRGRKLENVIDELIEIQNTFEGKRIVIEFVDNSFEDPYPESKERIEQFLDLLEKTDLRIAFAILTRTESWTEKDIPLIQRMRRAGLYYVAPGVESSVDIALRKFKKRGTAESNRKIFKLFQENDVYVHAYLIMFYPYVTFEELRKNAEFMKDNNMTSYPFNWYHSMALHPDTEIFQQASRDGLIIGFDEESCFYKYQFTDGRIAEMFEVIRKMAQEPSVASYMNLYEVTRFEEALFNIWKEQYEEMKTVEVVMKEYIEEYHRILLEVGKILYVFFDKMYNEFEKRANRNSSEYIEEWNRIIISGYDKLNILWKKNNVKLLRKGIKLL